MILTIADRIRELRDLNGMTQTDLANRLGISRSAVNSWEMSLSTPSIPNIIEMTRIFNVSADYILSSSDRFLVDITNLTSEQKEAISRVLACFH